MPKYPHIVVDLIGQDGNAFSILAKVKSALAKSKDVDAMAIDEFMKDAMSGDYNHLLQVVMEWVNIGGECLDEEFEEYDDSEDDEVCFYCGEEYINCICDEDECFEN